VANLKARVARLEAAGLLRAPFLRLADVPIEHWKESDRRDLFRVALRDGEVLSTLSDKDLQASIEMLQASFADDENDAESSAPNVRQSIGVSSLTDSRCDTCITIYMARG
jgi:hypothetical protein